MRSPDPHAKSDDSFIGSEKEQGLTQTQLAHLAGQRQEMISKIETGQGGVKLDTLFNVLTALRLELVLEPRSQSSAADIEDIV